MGGSEVVLTEHGSTYPHTLRLFTPLHWRGYTERGGMAIPPRPASPAQVNYALRLLKQQGLAAPTPEEVEAMPSVEVSSLIDGLLAKRGKPVFYGNGTFSHWQKAAGANLTPIRQRTQFTCVAASTAMCLQALGVHNCDEDMVNHVLGAAPMKGATWEQVLATAQHYGVRATLTVPTTLSQVKAWTDAGKPVMIGWNPEGREWSHASVVFDVQECPVHGFMVHVADPNCPDPEQTVRIVPKSEFYSKWYEKFPNYLVRRPALMLEREVTPEGRQVIASLRSPVLVDAPTTVPVEVPMSKQAKSPVQVGPGKKDPNVVRGEAPAFRNPVVQQSITRGWGSGTHQNRGYDVAKGTSRKEKHKGQWGKEYMTLPVEEACGAEYMGDEACGAEYMQDHSAKFEEGVSVDPTKNMSKSDAAEWKKQNAIHRNEFTASTKGLLPSEIAHLRSAGADPEVAKATRMLNIATKASRAVPASKGEQLLKEMRAFDLMVSEQFHKGRNQYAPADPALVQQAEAYRAEVLAALKQLSGIAVQKDNFYGRGKEVAEAVRKLPTINQDMDELAQVAAFGGYLWNGALMVEKKAKEAAWRVAYLTHWLDFYKTNGRSPSWDEQDEWIKKRRQASTRSAKEKYPWNECIDDQMEQYGDKEKAEKVCGAIKAKSQGLGSFKGKKAELLPSEVARLRSAGLEDACWEGYEAVGMKEQSGKQVPNCVPTKTAAHRLDGVRGHQLLPTTVARKLPPIYSQDNVDDPIVQVKLFSPYSGAVWYLTEYDPSSKQAFGWADLGMGMGELGYISIPELEGMNKGGLPLVERDLYFKPMPLSKAKHSRMASQHHAKFPKGEKMTVQEVAAVVGPEFADMNENPPESVLAVREQMAKQAARKFRAPF